MTLDEIKTAIRDLAPRDRRAIALYILELEKDAIRDTVGPQVSEDLDAVRKALLDAFDRIKQRWESR